MWEGHGPIILTILVYMHTQAYTDVAGGVQALGWLHVKGMLIGDLLFLESG